MANPYGMTEFDVTHGINALEAARSNRIRQMLLQRQIAQEEQQLDRQSGIAAAMQRYTGGGDAGSASAAPPEAPVLAPPSPDAPMTQPAPGAAPPAAPGTTPAGGDRDQLFRDLLAIDPPTAFQVSQAFAQMDDAQFEASTRRNGFLARAAYHLLALPEEQWSAEFQRIAPFLMQEGGITRQQLTGFELSRRNLTHVISQASDIERLAEASRPSYRTVEGEVINERLLGTNQDPVVFRSEFVRGPDGLLYRRNNAGTPPPVLSDEDMERIEQGGPSPQGSGGFP